jgi:hypothetical protein
MPLTCFLPANEFFFELAEPRLCSEFGILSLGEDYFIAAGIWSLVRALLKIVLREIGLMPMQVKTKPPRHLAGELETPGFRLEA